MLAQFTARYQSDFEELTWEFLKTIYQPKKLLFQILDDLARLYQSYNKPFFQLYGTKKSMLIDLNNELITMILTLYKNLDGTLQELSENLEKDGLKKLFSSLVPQIEEVAKKDKANHEHPLTRLLIMNLQNSSLTYDQIINAEYEARRQNKGVLWRGTSFHEHTFGVKPSARKGQVTGVHLALPYEKVNASKKPYSISFGLNPFDAIFFDPGACAIKYLLEGKKLTGYALLIDKKAYVAHRNEGLFYIPNLSAMTALFLNGEFCHARSTAAVIKKKPHKSYYPKGIATFTGVTDPRGLLIIERDPYKHEALLSKFLSQNMLIIQKGNEKDLTQEEKNVVHKIQQAHKEHMGMTRIARFMHNFLEQPEKQKGTTKTEKEQDEARQEQKKKMKAAIKKAAKPGQKEQNQIPV